MLAEPISELVGTEGNDIEEMDEEAEGEDEDEAIRWFRYLVISVCNAIRAVESTVLMPETS
jgi:hypothetical protein